MAAAFRWAPSSRRAPSFIRLVVLSSLLFQSLKGCKVGFAKNFRVSLLNRGRVGFGMKSDFSRISRGLGHLSSVSRVHVRAKKDVRGPPQDKKLRKLLQPYGVSEASLRSLETLGITTMIANTLSDEEFGELDVVGDDLLLIRRALNKLPPVPTAAELSSQDIRDDNSFIEDQDAGLVTLSTEEEDDWENDFDMLGDDGYEQGMLGDDGFDLPKDSMSIFAANEKFDEEEEDEMDDHRKHRQLDGENSNSISRDSFERRRKLLNTGESTLMDRSYSETVPDEAIEELGAHMLKELQKQGVVRKALPGLPAPRKVKITSSEFIGSAKSIHYCPPPRYVEIAVIGRSNVGKSSLINSLTGNKKLAAVSKVPGKTRSINHYLIDGNWYLVDLPGYGYAKVRKTEAFGWHKATQQYFLDRKTLALVLLLVDSSIPPQDVDLDCAYWMAEAKIPFLLVFTKSDKSKKGSPKPQENIKTFLRTLSLDWENPPAHVTTSSFKGQGMPELLTYLSQVRSLYKDEVKQGFWTQARQKETVKKFGKKTAGDRRPGHKAKAKGKKGR